MMRISRKNPPAGISTAIITVLLAAVICAMTPSNVSADKASSSLEKFKEPVDKAVDLALAFLAKKQITAAVAVKARKPALAGAFESRMVGNTGISSLCVMAFLAKGHTPGTGPYGDVINNGIDYILSTSQPMGC